LNKHAFDVVNDMTMNDSTLGDFEVLSGLRQSNALDDSLNVSHLAFQECLCTDLLGDTF